MAHAVKLLTSRPHSKAELTTKLATVCYRRQRSKLLRFRQPFEGVDCSKAVASSIQKLQEMNLLDDDYYAAWHVEQRAKFRPRSKLQLRGELAAKGVDGGISSKAIEGANDLLSAYALALRKPRASPDELLAYLARKGFSPQIALLVSRCPHEERARRAAELAERSALQEPREHSGHDNNDDHHV